MSAELNTPLPNHDLGKQFEFIGSASLFIGTVVGAVSTTASAIRGRRNGLVPAFLYSLSMATLYSGSTMSIREMIVRVRRQNKPNFQPDLWNSVVAGAWSGMAFGYSVGKGMVFLPATISYSAIVAIGAELAFRSLCRDVGHLGDACSSVHQNSQTTHKVPRDITIDDMVNYWQQKCIQLRANHWPAWLPFHPDTMRKINRLGLEVYTLQNEIKRLKSDYNAMKQSILDIS